MSMTGYLRRVTAEEMRMITAEIYACRNSGELELAQDYLPQLQLFYMEAASNHRAMLQYVQ